MPVVNNIREFAVSRGCETSYQFHKLTGIPYSTAHRLWTKTDTKPKWSHVEVICKTFQVQVNEFITYVEETSSNNPRRVLSK